MTCDVPPEARCSNCRALTLDEAGLKAVFCQQCGHCDHPHASDRGGKLVCDACGREVAAPAAEPDAARPAA